MSFGCHVGSPFFVCEFATNGTLVSYLRKYPDELWAKLHEAALGVQYLHARNVVHGDLKGNNIVIGSDKKAKVTDFGLSAVTNDGVDPRISEASHWVAPECFIHEFARPTFESDIYALVDEDAAVPSDSLLQRMLDAGYEGSSGKLWTCLASLSGTHEVVKRSKLGHYFLTEKGRRSTDLCPGSLTGNATDSTATANANAPAVSFKPGCDLHRDGRLGR
ncbi:hypothetical protein PF010_g10053 [Phytophthora fragariae]|uniref:Protein kinase domain-containing protein n=1 Tax=Phytophthora fragariae TaxID=53985 RepID=A0A6G0LAH7_9STRA|nr:hypothetical protein PF010_g10053 [Phytophthora fragariae]